VTEDARLPPRKGGRPRVDDPRTTVTTYVRTADYDRLVRLALKHDRTVSAIVRDLLKLKL
jgi:hypothetical protein